MIDGLKPYPEYKDSGVSWLGTIPSKWEMRRQRHVAKMLVSNVDKHTVKGECPVRLCNYVDVYKNDRITERIQFMRATATVAEVESFRLRKGDVLITKDSEESNDIGVPALVEYAAHDLVCGYHLAILRPRQEILRGDYLLHALRCPGVAAQYHNFANGVTRFGLSQADIKSVLIPIPPTDEQAVIARFLDHSSGRIERAIYAKKKLIALLNEQKQAIVQRAVSSGLESITPPKFRKENSVPNIGIASASDKRISSAQIGIPWLTSLPDRWRVLPSKRLFSAQKEAARAGDVQLSATQAYGVIPQAEFEKKVGRRVVRISMHFEKRRHVEKDDFVISMRSFQGGLERAWASGCIRSSYVVLRPISDVDTGYFSYLFKSHGFIQALRATSNFIRDGQDLNFSNFCLVELPLVPLDEQKAIAAFLDEATASINTAIDRARREVNLLLEFRTRLTADVVTGRVDVRDAARDLPATTEEIPVVRDAEEIEEEADA